MERIILHAALLVSSKVMETQKEALKVNVNWGFMIHQNQKTDPKQGWQAAFIGALAAVKQNYGLKESNPFFSLRQRWDELRYTSLLF